MPVVPRYTPGCGVSCTGMEQGFAMGADPCADSHHLWLAPGLFGVSITVLRDSYTMKETRASALLCG